MALVDTERGSATKYADLFEFDVLELESYDPARLIEIINYVARTWISSSVHRLALAFLDWQGRRARQSGPGRTPDAEPQQLCCLETGNSVAQFPLIDKIIRAPLHILASMRAKTEWILDRDERTGKTVPRKVGLAPVMRDGIEYEFDVCGDMDQENTLIITKTRCPKLAAGVFPKPGRELADLLKEWLGGAPVDKNG